MFTGIVQEVGEIQSKTENTIEIEAQQIASAVSLGSSVCVSGVCLTVSSIDGNTLSFDVMDVTLEKSTLGEKNGGDSVNLESSLRAGDEIGGHFVYGHVDGVGEVAEVVENKITIKAPKEVMTYVGPQGSIAIDGVSLTVADFDADAFTVSLVPFTLEQTTFGNLQRGDKVNLEADMLAKYISRMTKIV